ncbi:hypothetical protein TI04_07250 [Achromatium sp. WMS2]|nr:hypothetical protein TI04_07250 [Achromatium sp. WMS2]
MNDYAAKLEIALAPIREQLTQHILYQKLRDSSSLHLFMQAHVFAVWDFQTLMKALQRQVM